MNSSRTSHNGWKLAVALGVAAVLVFTAAACGSDKGSAGGGGGGSGASTIIKLGTLFPMTGDLALFGTDMQQSVQQAVDEINAAGGIKSMGGAKLEIAKGDSQSKPDVAVSEVERFAQQGVSIIMGTYQSSVALPATQAAERLQLPFMVSIATADEITERGYKYTFRMCPKAEWYAKNELDLCKISEEIGGPPIKRVALIHEDTDWGQSTSEGQKKYIKEYGFELVADVAYPASSADLTTQVSKVQASKPDIVLATTYLNDSILLIQARERLGFTGVPWIDTGGTSENAFIERLGESAEGVMSLIEYTKFAKGMMELNDRHRELYGHDWTGQGNYSYQATYVIADALERAGSADREALRDALAATDYTSANGPIVMPLDRLKFDETGQLVDVPLYICQITNGDMIPVFPAAFAAAKVKL